MTDKRIMLYQCPKNDNSENFQNSIIDHTEEFYQNIRNIPALSAWPISHSQSLILAEDYHDKFFTGEV